MNQTKINEVVYTYKGFPAFLYKGAKLTPEKIKHYRETYPELKDAAPPFTRPVTDSDFN